MTNQTMLKSYCLGYIAAFSFTLLMEMECQAEQKLQYNRDIKPILSDKCFACHGPDDEHRAADLRLDLREAAVDAAAIVPGDVSTSELIRRMMSTDQDEVMPPPKSKKTVSPEEIALLKQWIEQGAEYQQHWSFTAPEKPQLPQVSDPSWCQNEIDYFILNRLDEAGLKPSPEADRATLIRRLSYDLTGLPPSLEELDRFLSLDTDNWYEQVIDHYLAQPAFGERMALAWMDAARYGDTSVFHADGPRDMWPWRDWVIQAYQENKPFDQFTIEQLAGDLIPDATPYQKIASGFNRNHATTDEGGAIAEEWRVDYVVDRVKTTSNVWMGISMECGQCHGHKFDPISHKEYYGFFAFFNQTSDPGMQTRRGNQVPVVNVPDMERDAKIEQMNQQIAQLNQQIQQNAASIDEPFQNWVSEASEAVRSGEGAKPPADMTLYFSLDETEGQTAQDSAQTDRTGTLVGQVKWVPGKAGNSFQVEGSSFIEIPEAGNFDMQDTVSYGCWVKPQGTPNGAPIAKMNEANQHRGWDLYLQGGNVAVHIINSWPNNAVKVTTKNKIPNDQWTHVFATYDGSGKAAGVKIYVNGQEQEWNIERDSLNGTTISQVPLKIGRRHNSSQYAGLVDDVRMYARVLSEQEIKLLAGADPISPILVKTVEERTEEEQKTLRTHYLTTIDDTNIALTKQKSEQAKNLDKLKSQIVTSMIMGEQEKPRDTYVLMRGHYASPDTSEVIKPAIPSVFPPLPEGAPNNRLGLAQWLVSPEHPLTSRVTVNRYWTMMFGRGIVATPMDFGSQGMWPSHPELLDWLAVNFQEHDWDIKRTLKTILLSATYRQSSRMTPELSEHDPENILLARGPRFRMQGDFVRDTALAVSGLLNQEVGGPGVKPYQPPGLWNEVSLSGNVRFVADQGPKLYRKSMYIYWKRSSPHPGMRIFDAPTREKCVVQRPTTNTPLQALYTMNDTQFVEAARHLAQRMMTEGGVTNSERITYGHRLLLSNVPDDQTLTTLDELYQLELNNFRAHEEQAQALLGIGDSPRDESLDVAEHAAWTSVAHVLLNMDASLTKF